MEGKSKRQRTNLFWKISTAGLLLSPGRFCVCCIVFTYENDRERGGNNKSNIFSGYSRIEDHWFKGNRITRRRALTLADLDLRVETKNVEKGKQNISCDPNFMLGIMD